MGTPLESVYQRFLSKTSDYSFLKLEENGLLNQVLRDYLNSSITRFTNCRHTLDIDEDTSSFKEVLTNHEQEILSVWMTFYHVGTKEKHVKVMEPFLSESDYTSRTKKLQLDSLMKLKESIQIEASNLQSTYELYEHIEEM